MGVLWWKGWLTEQRNAVPALNASLEGPALPELLQGYQRSQKAKQKELMMRSMRKEGIDNNTANMVKLELE